MKSARKHGKANRLTHPAPAAPTDDFVARHGVALVALTWCVLRAWQWAFIPVSPQQDVTAYFAHASAWMQGLTPYVQFQLEYPPGALPVWWVPRLFADSFETYRTAFGAWMLVFDVATVALLWRATAALRREDAGRPKRAQVSACVLYIVGTAMLGSLLLQRYDPVLGCMLMGWWTFSRAPKTRWLADAMLALGIWVKLMAVLVVPIYWLHLAVTDTQSARKQGADIWQALGQWARTQGVRRAATLIGGTLLLFAPFYMQAGDKLWGFLAYHCDRGIQVETTWASLFLMARMLFAVPVTLDAQFGAIEIVHPWGAACAKIAGVSAAIALLATAARIGVRLVRSPDSQARDGVALDGAVAMLLGFMAFNKVLSPQYLLWLAPLAALATQRGDRAWRLAGMGAVFLGTGLNWLFYYPQLFAMERWPIVVMALRNLATVLMWVGIAIPLSVHWARHPVLNRAQRYIVPATAALLMAWAVLLHISVTPGDDIWLRLSEGAQVTARHGLTGFGTEGSANGAAMAVPHSWLAGVMLHAVRAAFGDKGITALGAIMAAMVAAMLATMVHKAQRFSAPILAGLAVTVYVIALRGLSWPDALGLLAMAAIMACMEASRRVQNVRPLLALPVIQLAWINADAHAVLGPLVVLAMAAARLSDKAARREALELAAAACAMVVTTCINPDGSGVVRYAGLGEVNPFARAWMWQWTSTFSESVFFYWPWLFMALLVVTMFGLVIRIPERVDARILNARTVDDTVCALIALALAYHAGVFAPIAAIILWPACARSIAACTQRLTLPVDGRAMAWANITGAALLLCNALTYGYGVSDAEHRAPLTAGVGSDLPYTAVQKLREERVQGALFNDFNDGGFLLATLAPALKPVIDSRIESFMPQVLQEYQSAYANPQAFADYTLRHHVNAALFYRARATPSVLDYLDRDGGWEKAMDADNRVLYVRRGEGPRTELSAY